MCETKTMPKLVEANCGSCAHCERLYYEAFMWFLLKTPGTDKKRLALGRCIPKNILVTLVSSCKEWANAEEV